MQVIEHTVQCQRLISEVQVVVCKLREMHLFLGKQVEVLELIQENSFIVVN